MSLIIGLLTILYIFGLSPLLLGKLWQKAFTKKEGKLAEIYVMGWLFLFAGFCLLAIGIMYGSSILPFDAGPYGNGSLKVLAKMFFLVVSSCNCLGLICFLLDCRKNPGKGLRNWMGGLKKQLLTSKLTLTLVLVSIALIPITVLLVRPYGEDTIEQVSVAVSTDTMYVYDPYLGTPTYTQATVHRHAPFEMFFGAAVQLSGLNETLVIRYLGPIFLLPLYYACVFCCGQMLFPEEGKKQKYFYLMVLLLSSYPLYTGGSHLAVAILTNPWYKTAILNCIVFPFIVVRQIKKNSFRMDREELLSFLIFVLAAQLMHHKGAYYVVLIYLVSNFATFIHGKMLAKRVETC